ncbi:MAG TPA: hypothetical protein VK137_17015 [Planctomycetaceae bacterium]|nr:hypothetical protein [Planctomycetaceae bacterium]
MPSPRTTIDRARWTARELRRLPPHERDKILEAAAQAAASEYRNDRQLTDFEAFGKDDLHGDSSDSEAR